MRKKIVLCTSILLICLAGILILATVVYFEKAEQKEREETAQEIKGVVSYSVTEEDTQEKEIEENGQTKATLVFAGDVYISPYVQQNYTNGGIDGVVSTGLLSQMQNADICMVNEEFPFGTTGTPMEDKQFTFRVEPSYVTLLTDMGVDVVSLANNHVLDYGAEPLKETFDVLNRAGIDYAGAGNSKEEAAALKSYEIAGETYGILSASRVIPVAEWNIENGQPGVFTTYDETALVAEIKKAKEICDYLIVYVHWGIERTIELEEYQKYLAHAYVDAGADFVIGSHPHILQGIEKYNGKLIFYSLGNYIFNQGIERTMLLKIERENGQETVTMIPAYATGAKTMEYENVQEFSDYMQSLSKTVVIENNVVR